MSEAEIRELCYRSREIFISQPILLELEAPIKICGKFFYDRNLMLKYAVLAENEPFVPAFL